MAACKYVVVPATTLCTVRPHIRRTADGEVQVDCTEGRKREVTLVEDELRFPCVYDVGLGLRSVPDSDELLPQDCPFPNGNVDDKLTNSARVSEENVISMNNLHSMEPPTKMNEALIADLRSSDYEERTSTVGKEEEEPHIQAEAWSDWDMSHDVVEQVVVQKPRTHKNGMVCGFSPRLLQPKPAPRTRSRKMAHFKAPRQHFMNGHKFA